MARISVGSNTLACFFKAENRDRAIRGGQNRQHPIQSNDNRNPSRNELKFFTFNLKSIEYVEAVKEFHQVYMDKLSYFQNNPNIENDQIVTYHVRYFDALINILQTLSNKYQGENSLPFTQMGYLLRSIQSFVLDYNISKSLLKLHSELFSARPPQSSSQFLLNTFFTYIKAGNLFEARKYFQKYPNYSKHPQTRHIEACLNPENRVFGLMYTNEKEFLIHFDRISAESRKILRACEDHEDFKRICLILTGDLESFLSLKPNWLEIIIFFSLFKVGIIYNTEEISKVIASRGATQQGIEKMMITAFIDNLHLVVQQASEVFPSFFIAHIVDVLAVCGKVNVDPQDIFEHLNYPEYYFLNFVNEILPNLEIPLEVVCDYIYHNLGGVENCDELLNYANKIRVKTENVEKSVQYFFDHKLENIALSTYKYAGLEALNTGKLSLAIEYALRSKDQEFKYLIESRVLNIAAELNVDHIRLIVQAFNQKYNLPALDKKHTQHGSVIIHFFTVLLKYYEFIESKNIVEAGNLLVKFFCEDSAPVLFYKNIFEASVQLFDAGLSLSSRNFFIVLKAYEKLCTLPNVPQKTIQTLSQVLAKAASFSLV